MIIRLAFVLAKYFVYVGYPLHVFALYRDMAESSNLWKYWLTAIISVAGAYLLVMALEKFLHRKGFLKGLFELR